MIGVILAAGMAKRLRPLTDTKPKCLLTVGSRTLLQRTVDAMAATGIREFVIVTGYRHEMIQDFLNQNFPNFTFHFLHNADYAHNNNIYSLWMSGQVVRGKEFLLMDSDILCDPQAVAAVASQSESALALNRHELNEEDMKIVVDSETASRRSARLAALRRLWVKA
jgi:choline kinase